jgi:hypothetical protein
VLRPGSSPFHVVLASIALVSCGGGDGSRGATHAAQVDAADGDPGDARHGSPQGDAARTPRDGGSGPLDVAAPPAYDASPADFESRCKAPGVLVCNGFDSPSDIAGTYGSPKGTLQNGSGLGPATDTSMSASGAGSLRFTIPSRSSADEDGSFFQNFSTDLSVSFGDDSDFYVQWRQWFDAPFLADHYTGGEGWKQIIIGTGDAKGCTPSYSTPCASSCTAPEIVTLNSYHTGFLRAYNSCTGSTSHGAYDPFEEPYGSYDFKLQNAMPAPYCLYSQGQTKPPAFFPPAGNCAPFVANEWMTFQIHVHVGSFVVDEYRNSHVDVWVARQGGPSVRVFEWGPYALSAGSDHETYGKLWLLPYDTGRDPSVSYAATFTSYDELIVSRQPIADPLH